jgi:hypothetical protein
MYIDIARLQYMRSYAHTAYYGGFMQCYAAMRAMRGYAVQTTQR